MPKVNLPLDGFYESETLEIFEQELQKKINLQTNNY